MYFVGVYSLMNIKNIFFDKKRLVGISLLQHFGLSWFFCISQAFQRRLRFRSTCYSQLFLMFGTGPRFMLIYLVDVLQKTWLDWITFMKSKRGMTNTTEPPLEKKNRAEKHLPCFYILVVLGHNTCQVLI